MQLFFVRPAERAAGDTSPPVVVLAGGPGSSHGGFAARQRLPVEISEALGREVIYVDQRGVPLSQPDTLCPELDEADDFAEEFAAFAACNARFEAEDIDIHAFNTIENAADIAAIPTALGVEQVDLIAGSYATRLALKVLERHPDSVRAAILGGVDVPGAPEANPGNAAFEEVFQAAAADYATRCAASTECAEMVPNFDGPALLSSLIAQMEGGAPVEIAGIPFASPQQLAGTLFSMMYVSQIRNMFFAAMSHADRGENEAFYAHVGDGDADAGRTYLQRLLAAARNAVFGGASGMSVATRCYDGSDGDCAILGSRRDDYSSEEYSRVEGTEHPILMVSGALDPATLAANATPLLSQFTNARQSLYPCLGHDISRISNRANGTCMLEQAAAFLADPSAELPACTEALCDALPLVPDQSDLGRTVAEYVEGFE